MVSILKTEEIRAHEIAHSAIDKVLNNPAGAFSKNMVFPTDNFNKNLGWISFTELTQELDQDGLVLSTPRRGSSVYLYIPKEGLTVNDKADYANAEFGILGQAIETLPINEVNIVKGVEEGAKALTDAARAFTGQTKNVGLITKVLQQTRQANTTYGQAVRTRLGRTANPHVRAVFNQVSRREFSYSFELVPNNEKENRMIKQIVKYFRANLYPETENLENESGELLLEDYVYKFPNKFDIEYWFDRQRIGHKLKHCYLTGVKASFNNQNSMAFYPDGGFISTRLELQFAEERTISKKDVLDDTDGIGY